MWTLTDNFTHRLHGYERVQGQIDVRLSAVTLSLMSSLSFGYSSNLSARPVGGEKVQ